ncbi:MAG: fumarylacetoacetate hydrolase family protein [Halobacteriales archaeon]|nr:fumarylacetoacetate hydrolase family protein [Halobacteriales archaeon]
MRRVRFRADGTVYDGTVRDEETFIAAGKQFARESVTLLPPCMPTKIVATAMNSKEHVENIIGEEFPKPELPTFFFKAPSTIVAHGEPIEKPDVVEFLDYEAEIALVIGAECSRVDADEALEYLAGYTGFNDVSARDWAATEESFGRSKSMDTFGPLGPFLQTELELPIGMETRVNGEVRQDADTSELMFGIRELIVEASRFFTLHPGDVIVTGTPPGTAGESVPLDRWDEETSDLALDVGDVVEIDVESVGTLRNEVTRAPHD